ncbi:peroxidase P7-like [Nymphaea colorata]|nr:peroxidase P7-like [Nymphaea colorata]
MLVVALSVAVLLLARGCSSQLTPDFYQESCPDLLPTIRYQVQLAVNRQPRMGASLLRLFFHDCFVNGCDGSILLDDTATFVGEKKAAPNLNSARGFEVIDAIKAAVDEVCPGVVSCADILALTAKDSVVELGGPNWNVRLGRRDAKTASQAAANTSIPPPTSNLNQLISNFQSHGLSVQDMVALSGAHTIGFARCTNFRSRIYNETNINGFFAETRQPFCPSIAGSGDNNLAPLDSQTPRLFDNSYFDNLIAKRGLLHSDQQLFNGGSTDSQVRAYSEDPDSFENDFVTAMTKMGDIQPLTGSNGEIRKDCRRVN